MKANKNLSKWTTIECTMIKNDDNLTTIYNCPMSVGFVLKRKSAVKAESRLPFLFLPGSVVDEKAEHRSTMGHQVRSLKTTRFGSGCVVSDRLCF